MSALSPAPGVRWANLLTPLESALTDCCLSYKQNAPVSPLESALTNPPYLFDSAYFKTPCFDTHAQTSPVSPLESALTKTPGAGVPQNIRDTLRFRHHTRHVAPLSPVASLDCAYFPSPRGCTTPTRSRFSPRLPQTQLTRPLFSYSYKPRYPQPLSFHVHTKPPGPRSGGSRFLLLATRHSPLPTAPLFSYSYELLFPQLPCFDNHPHCPGGDPLPRRKRRPPQRTAPLQREGGASPPYLCARGWRVALTRYGSSNSVLSPGFLPLTGRRRAESGLCHLTARLAMSPMMSSSCCSVTSPGSGTVSRPVPHTAL